MPATTPVDAAPGAPGWLRDLFTARTAYEEAFGWPATVHVTHRRLQVMAGVVFDAVTMPAPLGEAVLTRLRIAMLAGPVLAGDVGRLWTVLTKRCPADRVRLTADLHTAQARAVSRYTHLVLPTSPDSTGWPRWVLAPRSNPQLPTWANVIATTRRVLADADLAVRRAW